MVDDKVKAPDQAVRDAVEAARGISSNAAVGRAQEERVLGVVDSVNGKVKEAVGNVLGQDGLARNGKAQQHRANTRRDMAKTEAESVSDRRN
jgi:uncharacterized protein YjbJ (UPF0337 family)